MKSDNGNNGNPPNSTALAKTGAYRDPVAINRVLKDVAATCHLLSPASTVGSLPEGCEIVLSAVQVSEQDTYSVRGGNALKKTALDLIAGALGVSWLPNLCYRADDGISPYFVHYKAAGVYKSLDGQPVTITGEKIMDLRTGSPMAEGMKEAELVMARSHILSHAESKAKNRAIRSTGLRPSYSTADLAKPFICARIMFTGRTDDPELKRQFAADISRSFMGGSQALYGGEERALPPAGAAKTAPPPVGSVRDDDDDAIPAHGEPMPSTKAAPSGYTVNVQGKATPIETAPIEALQRSIAQCSADLADGVVPPDEVDGAREWRKAAIAQVEARGQY